MATRIRYQKEKQSNVLKSKRFFRGQQGAYYRVYLNLDNHTYKIVNVNQNRIIKSTEKDNIRPPKHLNTLKRQAKNSLKSLGVDFNTELRGINL